MPRNISTLNGSSLKLVDKFTYLGSSVSSTKTDIDMRLIKAWTAINRLSVIWKSDLTDKMKCSFFQAAIVLILLYGCTTWMLTKWLEKKLDGNYTRMLRAILNKSRRQHSTKQQLYGYLPPITKTIQVRRTRLLEKQGRAHKWYTPMDLHTWPSKSRVTSSKPTYSSSVRIRGAALRTCQMWWTIGRGGERGSGISAQQDEIMISMGVPLFC